MAARDLVQSYARNLGEWVDKENKPLAGLRMEIPERLMGDFKTLEMYGHNMKQKHGKQFKRHIKTDDTTLGLYMDAYIPKLKKWTRLDIDTAKEDNNGRREKERKLSDKGLFSTCGDDGSEDEQME